MCLCSSGQKWVHFSSISTNLGHFSLKNMNLKGTLYLVNGFKKAIIVTSVDLFIVRLVERCLYYVLFTIGHRNT